MAISSAVSNNFSKFVDGLEECGNEVLDLIKEQGYGWEFCFRTASCLPQNKYFARPVYKFLAEKFGNDIAFAPKMLHSTTKNNYSQIILTTCAS
jgi:glutamine synthetase